MDGTRRSSCSPRSTTGLARVPGALQGDHRVSGTLQGDHRVSGTLQGDHRVSGTLQGDHRVQRVSRFNNFYEELLLGFYIVVPLLYLE
jgi:hypothetical protein